MRIVDGKWVDLAAGYRAVRSLQSRLENEFGRAVQVGHDQKFRKELSEWQRKRRIFIAMVVVAPLSVIGLCATAYYFREVACVIVYWAVVVLTILVTLAVAGRNYIRAAVNRPQLVRVDTPVVDLEERWWNSLAPKEVTVFKAAGKGEVNFVSRLGETLSEAYLTAHGLPETTRPASGSEVILFGPSGIWLFVVCRWTGRITKRDGTWRQTRTFLDKLGRKKEQVETPELGPDEQWLRRKRELVDSLHNYLPDLVGSSRLARGGVSGAGARQDASNLIQGGVVFSSSRAVLNKTHIQGNSAAYGAAGAWTERIRRGQPVDGFTLEVQLQALEVLASPERGRDDTASAKQEAERLYEAAVQELRTYVAQMVQ